VRGVECWLDCRQSVNSSFLASVCILIPPPKPDGSEASSKHLACTARRCPRRIRDCSEPENSQTRSGHLTQAIALRKTPLADVDRDRLKYLPEYWPSRLPTQWPEAP